MSNDITYPKGEIPWVSYYDEHGNFKYLLTSKAPRDFYYLYEVTEGKLTKLGRSRNPKELEETYKI